MLVSCCRVSAGVCSTSAFEVEASEDVAATETTGVVFTGDTILNQGGSTKGCDTGGGAANILCAYYRAKGEVQFSQTAGEKYCCC